jgi:hypothetical protein
MSANFIVEIPSAERQAGVIGRDTATAAYKILHETGALLLRDVFAPAQIDVLHQEFMTRLGGNDLASLEARAKNPPPNPVLPVGGARFELAMRLNGPFGDPALLANPLLLSFLGPLLGKTMRLSGCTAVAAFPGADLQHIHRDYTHLFDEYPDLGPRLPVHAINCSVPLLDIDMQLGPTGFWPGSHRLPDSVPPDPNAMASTPFRRGDCFLIDYRTRHAGMPNRGTQVRPIFYLVYARDWFFDAYNHSARIPLDITLDELKALPPHVHPLLERAFAQAHRLEMLKNRDAGA